jgi:hypothetical protein
MTAQPLVDQPVMKRADPAFYHRLYGIKKPRVTYYAKDFLDYGLMAGLTALVTGALYGFRHPMSFVVYVLCAMAPVVFAVRHGVEWRVPLILRRPQDLLYMFVYKLQNMRPWYFVAPSMLLLENLVIAATPGLPHQVEWMRRLALVTFYGHLLLISGYRTVILVDHLRKRELVREVLMQTPWKRVINEKTSMVFEVLHAYFTGLLTHIALIGPWYFVLTHVRFSLIFLLPVAFLNYKHYWRWLSRTHNSWFYRDHWLGHNSELEFVYLHGSHHDVIPSALIATGNGFLEGVLRHVVGVPDPFYNPIGAALVYTLEIKSDMDLHQYIPGIYPRFRRLIAEANQHSTHHYGVLEPYGLANNLDAPGVSEAVRKPFSGLSPLLTKAIVLDEELTGFKWDNPTHRLVLRLFAKYQRPAASTVSSTVNPSAESGHEQNTVARPHDPVPDEVVSSGLVPEPSPMHQSGS